MITSEPNIMPLQTRSSSSIESFLTIFRKIGKVRIDAVHLKIISSGTSFEIEIVIAGSANMIPNSQNITSVLHTRTTTGGQIDITAHPAMASCLRPSPPPESIKNEKTRNIIKKDFNLE